jgi:low affinity Fe/Cu permease
VWIHRLFASFAQRAAAVLGHPSAFLLAVLITVVWGLTGPVFHYSDAWQLVINTITNVVTFFMVFLIQHTQNRDTLAVNLKLNEVIRVLAGAQHTLLDLDAQTEEELMHLRAHYEALAQRAREELGRRHPAADSPEGAHS